MRIVPDGNIVDPQAFDTVKEGDRPPAVFGPDRPFPDMSKLDHNKGVDHYYED
jgi:hypothetical protein